MTNTPATQPATLTQYFQHLLEKEENRKKFNRYKSDITCLFSDWCGFSLGFMIHGENLDEIDFAKLKEMYQKEIICIALLSLDEFQVLNNEYRSMKNELLHDTINGDEQPYTEGVLDTMPKTLAKKYGSMLYDKSIEEIDEIFKSENIIEEVKKYL
jgi:hypothetical protein